MAIFAKSHKQTNLKTHTTVISASTIIKGTISSDCTIIIDGKHEGIVKASQTVTIGRSGAIDGDVAAKKLTITGSFHGTADCESVEVLAGGTLRGKVISENLTIDQDCRFEGESINRSSRNTAKESSKIISSAQVGIPQNTKAS